MANTNLDFSALFAGTAAQQGEPGTNDKGTAPKPAESPQNAIEQQQAPTLYRQAQRTQEAQKQESDIRKEYAENTRKTEALKNDILKGIQQGEDVYQLLYWAVQAVALTTHDNLFYEQAWTSIDAIYGTALAEPGPLQNQIEAARDRLEKIRAACVLEPEAGPRSIMEKAIEEHEKLIARLQGQTQTQGDKLEVESLRYDTDAGEFVPV